MTHQPRGPGSRRARTSLVSVCGCLALFAQMHTIASCANENDPEIPEFDVSIGARTDAVRPDSSSGGGGGGLFEPPPCTDDGPEVCDGKDNDCNGKVDDKMELSCGPCESGAANCIQAEIRGGAWKKGEHRNVVVGNDKGLHLPPPPNRHDYVWIANSPRDTVSKVHAATAVEEARFRVGDNPSRTAVDGNGDAWIAHRGSEGDTDTKPGNEPWENVIKIAGDCVPHTAPPVPTDECIILDIPDVGNLLRGIAIDARNDVWIGAWASKEVVHLDGVTGQVNQRIKLTDTSNNPYGAAIDEWGFVWVTSKGGQDSIIRIDPLDPKAWTVLPSVAEVKRNPYGLAADGDGRMWFGTNTKAVFSVDVETLQFRDFYEVGGSTRGVTIDDEGYLWAADSGLDLALKIDRNSGEVVAQVMVPPEPVGVAVDHDGFLWAVSEIGEIASKITPDGEVIATVEGLNGPYTYSDMTGSAYRVFRRLRGLFRHTFDSSYDGAVWSRVSYTGAIPESSEATVRLRAGDSPELSGDWTTVPLSTDWTDLGLTGRYLEADILLIATDRSAVPNLERLAFELQVTP